MDFLEFLEKQSVISFTGKINILNSKDNRFLGYVSMIDGAVVYSNYKEQIGESTLYSILIDDLEKSSNIKFIVEPEIISEEEAILKLDVEDLKDKFSLFVKSYLESKKLKPPPHLRILLKPEFVERGNGVEPNEFSLMKTISTYSLVSDIYQKSNLPEFEVTNGLVSLRKKGALRVVK